MNWSFLRMNTISRAIILLCACIFCVGTSKGQGGICLKKAVPYKAGKFAFAACTGDVNGDGKPDLIIANVGSETVSIYMGKGDGTFQAPKDMPGGAFPCFVAVGD